MKKIKTDNLVLADLRIYEKGKGAILDSDMPKVFLIKKGDGYYNVFNENEKYPLFRRIPYSNISLDGESYGSKIIPLSSDELEEVGICAIESNDNLVEKIKKDEYIDIKSLEELVVSSNLYFKDRKSIIKKLYFDEMKELYKKIPTVNDSEYFVTIYRPFTSLLIKTRINSLRRRIKENIIRDKYSELDLFTYDDIEKNQYYFDKIKKYTK